MCNPVQRYIRKFPSQCESKEFPYEICESSYMLENIFTQGKIGGTNLDSDINTHTSRIEGLFAFPERPSCEL